MASKPTHDQKARNTPTPAASPTPGSVSWNMFRLSNWMPLSSLPPPPNTSRSKIARMMISPISAAPSTRTDSLTSKKQSTLISSAATTANATQGISQPNQELKFVAAKYEKPPSSETSNSE